MIQTVVLSQLQQGILGPPPHQHFSPPSSLQLGLVVWTGRQGMSFKNQSLLMAPLTAPPLLQHRCSGLSLAGAVYTPRLFSPLADVSTLSGMHSSCPSFANVTDVWPFVKLGLPVSFCPVG